MIDYDLPYGFSKMDTVPGTIVRASLLGFEVALDSDGNDSSHKARAFVRGNGEIGQRVLISLSNFNKKHGCFNARLDGVLDDKPSLDAAKAALAA